jgi:6-pyruvoyltetrahydropterin/6-carboxytetrahydropterin synthase
MMYVIRKARFCASHRLNNPELSAEENRALFGACNNPHGHGHNYDLEVVVKGEAERKSGMFINLRDLKDLIDRCIVEPADHRSLDHDVPFMNGRISTTENLAIAIWQELEPRLPPRSLHKVLVRESENNAVEYTGPGTEQP